MRDETIHDTMRRILEDERQEAVEEAREGIRQEAVEEAREGIRQEAVEENRIEMANDMIKEGLPINLIAKISKLDLNLVKQLQLGK